MATYSVNQALQFFVAKTFKNAALETTDPAGTVGEIKVNMDGDIYFTYMGAAGPLRSPLIRRERIKWLGSTHAFEQRRALKTIKLSLDPTINGGAPVAGQEYIVRLILLTYASLSFEDQYAKWGYVYATPGMTAAQFYTAMAENITQSLSREAYPLFTVTADATGVTIQEVEQPWILGNVENMTLNWTVESTQITYQGDLYTAWAVIEDETDVAAIKDGTATAGTYVPNGKSTADREWFYMGERGDVYRNKNWPYVIHTTYLTDASQEYHSIDIHHYWQGNNEAVQHSDKDVQIVVPGGADGTDLTVANAIIAALNTAIDGVHGKVIPTLVAP